MSERTLSIRASRRTEERAEEPGERGIRKRDIMLSLFNGRLEICLSKTPVSHTWGPASVNEGILGRLLLIKVKLSGGQTPAEEESRVSVDTTPHSYFTFR